MKFEKLEPTEYKGLEWALESEKDIVLPAFFCVLMSGRSVAV